MATKAEPSATRATAASRPHVSVYSLEGKHAKKAGHVHLPSVFLSPIRPDIVQFVHTNLSKNKRQANGVSKYAGEQTSADSYGTGRAVARIPRVRGGGTHRSGQGAFGNMCRGGRMFSPKKTWRRWHRKVNVNQRRVAACSALAATAIPALVMARGHAVDKAHEIPIVVKDDIQNIKKTKEAVAALRKLEVYRDVQRSKRSRKVRAGKGKLRNRRYVQKRGPLIIYKENNGIVQAFRNLPGVEVKSVSRLGLLDLAPGGHLGRLCVWTEGAFGFLDQLYGSFGKTASKKKGFSIPRPIMHNCNLGRLFQSEQIKKRSSCLRKKPLSRHMSKFNPLANTKALFALNPAAVIHIQSQNTAAARKSSPKVSPAAQKAQQARAEKKATKLALIRAVNKKYTKFVRN